MKIRLLDRDDIRRFGSTIVDVSDHIGNGLLARGRAVRVDLQKIKPRKSFMFPPENKAMWVAPEEKAMGLNKSEVIARNERKPKAAENLFPKSIIP
jgi:hypothetical protein